jgi:hypothetical protein
VAAAGVLAAVGLSACRSETGTAAFVGDTRIAESHVDSVVGAVKINGTDVTDSLRSTLRQYEVRNLAFIALAEKDAAAKGITLPTASDQQVQQFTQARLGGIVTDGGASKDFVRDWTQADLDETTLAARETPVIPTEAQLRDIYQRGVAGGVTNSPYSDQLKQTIAGITGLGQALALQAELAQTEKDNNVSVNPRYYPVQPPGAPAGTLEYPLIQVQNANGGLVDVVVAPLGAPNTGAVIDLPQIATPAPAATDQSAP